MSGSFTTFSIPNEYITPEVLQIMAQSFHYLDGESKVEDFNHINHPKIVEFWSEDVSFACDPDKYQALIDLKVPFTYKHDEGDNYKAGLVHARLKDGVLVITKYQEEESGFELYTQLLDEITANHLDKDGIIQLLHQKIESRSYPDWE